MTPNLTAESIRATVSASSSDREWDAFLKRSRFGHFQQASFWAEHKSEAGWNCCRVVALKENNTVAGCQLLWRKSRFGRIGYVSKGPVIDPPDSNVAKTITDSLCSQARQLNLVAIIAQAPDDDVVASPALDQAGFIESNPQHVVETNLVVNTAVGREAVEKAMGRSTRKNVRLAREAGVKVREGGPQDAAVFFKLMCSTCERQNTSPNPSSAEELAHLWQLLAERKCLKVFLAEHEGKAIAGLFCIVFGGRVSQWKKGWDSNTHRLYPNDLLGHAAITWAAENGYHSSDFGAFDRSAALAINQGIPLTPEQQKSRHIFNLRFGGVPVILPAARIWFPSKAAQIVYKYGLVKTGLLRRAAGLVS